MVDCICTLPVITKVVKKAVDLLQWFGLLHGGKSYYTIAKPMGQERQGKYYVVKYITTQPDEVIFITPDTYNLHFM